MEFGSTDPEEHEPFQPDPEDVFRDREQASADRAAYLIDQETRNHPNHVPFTYGRKEQQ